MYVRGRGFAIVWGVLWDAREASQSRMRVMATPH